VHPFAMHKTSYEKKKVEGGKERQTNHSHFFSRSFGRRSSVSNDINIE
jgi:hypothetical protein